MGHARALLSLETAEDQIAVREMIVKKKLSVRDTERKVNEVIRDKNKGSDAPKSPDVHLKALEDDLKRIFGTMVRIVGNDTRGFIQVSYSTRDDLMRIADKLKGENVPTPIGSV